MAPTIDVTDATFEQAVLNRSTQVPVIVDLWAPWCGPCRTLGPLIEKVVEESNGRVELAKINVDENPQVAAAFQVQSIPAVFALSERKVVDSFVGALPEAKIREFVERVGGAPAPSEVDLLVAAGDEDALRKALVIEPDHPGAVVALAQLLVGSNRSDEALKILARVPETAETRHVAALARLASAEGDAALHADSASITARLDTLLDSVKTDEEAHRTYLDLLEAMDPADPTRERYRRALASRLF